MKRWSIAIGGPVFLASLLACQPVVPEAPLSATPPAERQPEPSPSSTARIEATETTTVEPGGSPSPENPEGGIQLVEDEDYRGFIGNIGIYIAPEDDPSGNVRGGELNDGWVVSVEGQSQNGVFVRVRFIQPGPGFANQARYRGLSGWIFAYWLGQGMPLLPAQYPVLDTPDDEYFSSGFSVFSNHVLESIGITQRAQGTDDQFANVAPWQATQTQWAVLQTPQP